VRVDLIWPPRWPRTGRAIAWPPGRNGTCRFRYTKVRKQWSLYWRDRNLKFHEYDLVAPTPHLDEIIDYVANDRSGIFWG